MAYAFFEDGESESVRLTYSEFDARVRRLASVLQDRCKPGDRALLFFPPSLDFNVAFFACMYAGVIAVPAYPPRPGRSLGRLLLMSSDAQASVALTLSKHFDGVQNLLSDQPALRQLKWIAVDDAGGDADTWRDRNCQADDIAFLQYTSGSTSSPKGVMVTHANLLHNCGYIRDAMRATSEDRILSWLPQFHDMGLLTGVLISPFVGCPATLMSPLAFLQRPLRWLRAISTLEITGSGGPNFAYDLCVNRLTEEDLAALDLSSWRVAFNGAEPIRAQTLERFARRFAACGFRPEVATPCYGLAEATLAVTFSGLHEPPKPCCFDINNLAKGFAIPSTEGRQGRDLVACGAPAKDQTVRIVNPETFAPCPDGTIGEIWVSGPSVAAGYWGRDEESSSTFQARLAGSGEGPFLRTGDLGFLHDGVLFVAGRRKDLLIVRGMNFYPQDIELTVERAHPALRQGCGAAFALDRDGSELLVVANEVERTQVRNLDVDAVAAAIRRAVSDQHELDVHAVLLLTPGSIPKTSSGKIQRSACREAYAAGKLSLLGESVGEGEASVNDAAQASTTGHPADLYARVRDFLVMKLAQRLRIEPSQVDLGQTFTSFGLNSLAAVELASDLESLLGRPLAPTLAYEYPCIDALAHHLAGTRAPLAVIDTKRPQGEPIAIVGMACRFPGANNPDEFWALLRDGIDAITEVPADRWDISAVYDPNPATPRKANTKWGGFIDGVDQFDAHFFNTSPREAASMDPQQRILLEVAWEALEHANILPGTLAGTPAASYVGIGTIDYLQLQLLKGSESDAYVATGNTQSIASNRLAYFLDLRGPSVSVDTACSSALVALHQACASLRDRESNIALAGGVSVLLTPLPTVALSQARMMASDGRCKTFDASADGYVRSEGCGIVVLKRLADALSDGDNVLAVIRGTAVNHDGRSNGLTAPSTLAQQAVFRAALDNADVSPADITYIEAHGTGTSLGDPIEVESIKAVYGENRGAENRCAIASAKANVGHLEPAAGIVGLIKAVLALQHEEIPPHIHLKQVNPLIKIEDTPFFIPAERTPWPRGPHRRLAAVSAFGFGGTNSHVILEEAPTVRAAQASDSAVRPRHVLTLSARTGTALQAMAARYAEGLENCTSALADFCHTANTRRTSFEHRLALVTESCEPAESRAKLVAALRAYAENGTAPGAVPGVVAPRKRPKVAFLFTGQGAQFAGMGRQLYETESVYRDALNRCDELLRPHLELPLLSVLFPEEGQESPINQTAYTQPALFALEYALAVLWKSWGVVPDVVMGHSVGEYAAACLSGLFSLEDAIRLIAERARLIQSLPAGGKMAAVFADAAAVASAIAEHSASVSIAAVNGPNLTVISGVGEVVDALVDAFTAQSIRCTRMTVSHAFHSPLMDPILEAFHAAAREARLGSFSIPLISNRTGAVLGVGETLTAEYWRDHIRDAVQFDGGMRAAADLGVSIYVEIGPANTLIGMGRRCISDANAIWLPSLAKDADNWKPLLTAAVTLYAHGAPVDWEAVDRRLSLARVSVPTYPFERKRYWFNAVPGIGAAYGLGIDSNAGGNGTLAQNEEARISLNRLLYEVHWDALAAAPAAGDSSSGRWLVFADKANPASRIAQSLRDLGNECTLVSVGESLSLCANEWTMNPECADHYHAVLDEVSNTGPVHGVLFCWGADSTSASPPSGNAHLKGLSAVCVPALLLVQAVANHFKGAQTPRISFVTQGAHALPGDSHAPSLLQASLWGFARCVALEHPEVMGKVIDAVADVDSAMLASELHTHDDEFMVALRPGGRWGARLVPLYPSDMPKDRSFHCRKDVTYLITGAFGGLGAKVAEWLVEHGARRLLLMSRTAVPPRKEWAALPPDSAAGRAIATVLHLESLGASVHLAAVDVSDEARLREVLDEFQREQWPVIGGVMHAAGILNDQLLLQMDPRSFAEVARSKAAGAWNLHALLADMPLDFFVLFSSAASLLGSVGQANYAAANAYLDALAAWRRSSGLPALSINWGPWAEVGMAARPDRGARLAQQGMRSLDPSEALAAMGLLLSADAAQAGVLDADWSFLSTLFEKSAAFLSPLVNSVPAQKLSDRAQHILDSEGDERRALIEQHLCAAIAGVLHTDPALIPVDQSVAHLGLDSIMVMDLIRNLSRDLQFRIHPREVFEQPSLAAFAQYLGTELDILQQKRSGDAPPPEGFVQAGIIKTQALATPRAKVERKNPPCVFLLSAPRSGSTLLRVMLAGHPGLFSPPELHILHFAGLDDYQHVIREGNDLGDGLQRAIMEAKGLDAQASEALLEEWIARKTSVQDVYRMLQESVAPRLLVDKSPTYTGTRQTLDRAEDLFENALYLYLYRHPYAVIESYVKNRTGRMFNFGHADPYLLAEEVWTSHNQNTMDFLESVEASRKFQVRYEDLVADPERIMRAMCDFLRLPFDDGVLQPYAEGRMTDGVHASSRSIGDPNFLKHKSIEASLGEAWRRARLPRPLGDRAQHVAAILDYELPNESVAAASSSPLDEMEEERL
ncbi:MAG: SDR family NAD(P)-dependent oxidoreductase [Candidatus Hydrogenedentes bacterium]|nr:SDR family NAD(P)-dependent oxidoreductase [Candidatus Hydrogenedentota bacterium]